MKGVKTWIILSKELLQKLSAICDYEDWKLDFIVETALRRYLSEKNKPAPGQQTLSDMFDNKISK